MAKNTRGNKEFSKEQEIKYENRELRSRVRELEIENRQLRRRMAGSRKEMARMDLDRHSYVQEIIQEHLDEEQNSIDSTQLLDRMRSKWLCHTCNAGHMEIIVYSKMGEPWYYRQCSDCPNRTKGQTHHPGVEGINKEIPLEPIKLGAIKKSSKNVK